MIGSTYFRKLLPKESPVSNGFGRTEPVPVSWPEPASTITGLLYRLYPIIKPDIDNIEDLIRLAIAADKWGMEGVLADLQALLLKPLFLDSRPLAVYNVACRLSLDNTKRCAARRLVEMYEPLDPVLRPDTVGLSAPDFIALYELRKKRIAYSHEVLERHLPSFFDHRCDVVYNYSGLHSALSKNPSASILASLPDTSETTVELEGHGCSHSECASYYSKLRNLKEELADHVQFLGDESYL